MSAARLTVIVAGAVLAGVVLGFGARYLVFFFISDQPPGRSDYPLQVLAEYADDRQCNPTPREDLASRDDVAAGVHGIDVYTQGSGATVELRDERGNTVFHTEGGLQGSALAQTAEGNDALKLDEGLYIFVCRYPDGAVGEAALDVTAE